MTLTLPMKLPTSVVGSHGLPGWVWLAREAMAAGRLGALDLRELMEDATQAPSSTRSAPAWTSSPRGR